MNLAPKKGRKKWYNFENYWFKRLCPLTDDASQKASVSFWSFSVHWKSLLKMTEDKDGSKHRSTGARVWKKIRKREGKRGYFREEWTHNAAFKTKYQLGFYRKYISGNAGLDQSH